MDTAAPQASTLRDYLQVARRRKWIIIAATLLVPLAALAFSLHQQAQYQGSAQVLLSQQDLSSQLTGAPNYNNDPADRQAATQAGLARVQTIAQDAIHVTRTNMTPKTFLEASSVTAGTNSDLLTFKFTDHDQHLAGLLATAYAHAYVRYRLASDTAPIMAALNEVESQISKLPAQGSLYANLQDKATQLRTLAALKTANASVVQNAEAATQTAPKTFRNSALGAVLGLFVGLGLVFLREALDTRVRSAEAISDRLSLPLLARLPAPSRSLRQASQLVMLKEPTGLHSEAFRMLRTNLEFATLGKETKTIMVTSAVEQEGKSTTIANLAVALARSGQRVVLVDLDLRRPFLDRFFDLADRPGLTQVAIGRATLAEALVDVPLARSPSSLIASLEAPIGSDRKANGGGAGAGQLLERSLRVLGSGPIPPDPGEFVGTDRLAEILDELRADSDVVLIDAPPMFHVGDAMVLSAKVDAIVVVTRIQVLRRPMLSELHRLLVTAPALKLGFIVTGAEAEEGYGSAYGGYYHQAPELLGETSKS